MRIAMPADRRGVRPFGTTDHFALIDANPSTGEIVLSRYREAPADYNALVQWIVDNGTDVLVVSSSDSRTRERIERRGVAVLVRDDVGDTRALVAACVEDMKPNRPDAALPS